MKRIALTALASLLVLLAALLTGCSDESRENGDNKSAEPKAVTSASKWEWSKTFGNGVGYSVQPTSDGGYIVLGRISGAKVLLIKTDAEGNELWNKTFGGRRSEAGKCLQETSDGGFVISGTVSGLFGGGVTDVWLMKTDADGNILWSKTFDGSSDEAGNSVQQTSDGGYIIAGWAVATYGASRGEALLMKTDAWGNELWTRKFPSASGQSVQQTSDGGYIITGSAARSDGTGRGEVLLMKTDADGNELWNKTFGGLDNELGWSVQETTDAGYIIAGRTYSFGAGLQDVWLIKTDAEGNEVWNKTFGGSNDDEGRSVRQTSDGGYIIAGSTSSYGAGRGDVWLIKTDAYGNELWNRTFGRGLFDAGYSMQQTMDGGYIITGTTYSYAESESESDLWLIKISGE